jgi:hypothetical protein
MFVKEKMRPANMPLYRNGILPDDYTLRKPHLRTWLEHVMMALMTFMQSGTGPFSFSLLCE